MALSTWFNLIRRSTRRLITTFCSSNTIMRYVRVAEEFEGEGSEIYCEDLGGVSPFLAIFRRSVKGV